MLQIRLIGIALLASVGSAMAAPDIPETSGWSGHLSIGVGAGQAETNMIDGIGPVQMGDDRIDGLEQEASSESFGFPVLHFDIAYTIANFGTQFYSRFQPSPYIFLDLENHLGIRQRLEGAGIVDISLSTSAPVTKVWKDPYLQGPDRGDTDRSVQGLNLRWHNAMESPLTLEISSQEIEIDDEKSGESLPLSTDEQRLLRRQGQAYRYHVDYQWALNDRHMIVPGFSYLDYQLDGDAMAEDGVSLQLSHEYKGLKWGFTTMLYYRDLDAKKDNPIFGEAADRSVYGAAMTCRYSEPFNWKNWSANARVSWYESDNDIDFYDETMGLVMIGATYRFN